jgi:uncharacterized protein (UPF0264 family)
MSSLLVSVRSVAEAESALKGGADLIDIKEPARGSLGRADDIVLTGVAEAIAGRQPISAALGELADFDSLPPVDFLVRARFVKCGLAGTATVDWRDRVERLQSKLGKEAPACRLVLAAYADSLRSGAPDPNDVCALAIRLQLGGMLIDTWQKDGTTLLDWQTPAALASLCRHCREGGIGIAIAGSLDRAAILSLQYLEPDWFAVRGAACRGNDRANVIDAEQVRELVEIVRGS